MERATRPQRRLHPRIEVDGGHAAQDVTLGRVVRLRDVSEGGFQTESAEGATPGTTHTFRVTLRDGTSHLVRATARHSRAIVGWQIEGDQIATTCMRSLLDEVTSVDLLTEPVSQT